MARAMIAVIRLYQVAVSPWLGECCRFYPSCSEYCMEALRAHGAWRGSWLGLKRLARCQPFHAGGVDGVPPAAAAPARAARP
jgi:uncharacterized protein